MNRVLVSVPLALLLGACNADVKAISQAAESARGATERMASASDQASDARERAIITAAEDYEARQAALAGLDADRPRYEIRKDADGWTIYDTANNRPARLGPKTQSGLSREEAESSFASLMTQEQTTQQQFTITPSPPSPGLAEARR
jgi:hypothetical protein